MGLRGSAGCDVLGFASLTPTYSCCCLDSLPESSRSGRSLSFEALSINWIEKRRMGLAQPQQHSAGLLDAGFKLDIDDLERHSEGLDGIDPINCECPLLVAKLYFIRANPIIASRNRTTNTCEGGNFAPIRGA